MSYVFSVNHKGIQHIPFMRMSRLNPDDLEMAYLRGHGEFSVSSDLAFEKHLKYIRDSKLHEISSWFKRKSLKNLRIV